MAAATEAEMPLASGAEVELVRGVETVGVAVGGAEDHDHVVAAANRLAAQLHIDGGPAVERPLDRPVVADQLFDGVREQRRVAFERRALLGVHEQRERRVPDQADRRLVSRDDQERDHAAELLLGERVAAVLDCHERADEILAGRAPTLGEEREQVLDEGGQRGVGPLCLGRRERRAHHRGRPLAKALAVGNGNAEQLGDHRDRQREGELRDEVHLAGGRDAVDQLVGDLLDPRPQPFDHARCERLRDEAAEAQVVFAVAVEHVAVDERDELRKLRAELIRR